MTNIEQHYLDYIKTAIKNLNEQNSQIYQEETKELFDNGSMRLQGVVVTTDEVLFNMAQNKSMRYATFARLKGWHSEAEALELALFANEADNIFVDIDASQ